VPSSSRRSLFIQPSLGYVQRYLRASAFHIRDRAGIVDQVARGAQSAARGLNGRGPSAVRLGSPEARSQTTKAIHDDAESVTGDSQHARQLFS
jgi:hypothetical protein